MKTVSVIIPTSMREHSALQAVQSVLANRVLPLELLVVEQRGTGALAAALRRLSSEVPVRYFSLSRRGTSRAKNFGIQHACGEIIAFTDDDCLVDRFWISRIQSSFSRRLPVAAVFGSVRPYHPANHAQHTCPCTFTAPASVITRPCLHFQHIGYGNNMAWNRDILKTLGGFAQWLGPGSIGANGEDGELALRALISGYSIRTDPTVVVYHNKWLTRGERASQDRSYTCGGMACYGYFAAQGFSFARPVVMKEIRTSIREIWRFFRSCFTRPRHFLEFSCRIRGVSIGFFHALTHPVSVRGLS